MKKTLLKITLVGSLLIVSASATAKPARSGEEVYQAHCTTCHSPALSAALKSPLVHSQKQWQPYFDNALAQINAAKPDALKGANAEAKQAAIYKQLLANSIKGTAKGMPPKGTCMSCSDKELLNAIKFMSTEKKADK